MDETSWRELACMAIGAALVDKTIRPRLDSVTSQLWPISQIAQGLQENDGGKIWRGLYAGWGLESNGNQRAIDRVLDELARIHDVRLLSSLMGDLVNADGVPENVDRVLARVGDFFKGKWNGRTG